MSRFDGWVEPKGAPTAKKPVINKFGNRRVEVDGIKFDSALEARHYAKLKLLKRAGEIRDFERQASYDLEVNGQKIATYRADFVVTMPDGSIQVQDTKGYPTPEYKLKKKLMRAIYGIEIMEIKNKK